MKAADGKTTETHTAPKTLVATGCVSRPMPGLPFDGVKVIGSREAMVLPKQPASMIIIGAGAIGAEFAYFYNAYGTKVTMVEMMPNVLPVEDTEVCGVVEKAFVKQGIKVLTSTKTTKTEVTATGVKITVAGADGRSRCSRPRWRLWPSACNRCCPAAPEIQAHLARGYIETNDRYETSVPGVYGAGDIIGPPWLAHVASFEAVNAVQGMFVPGFKPKKVTIFPGCTYCHPQVASVGLPTPPRKRASSSRPASSRSWPAARPAPSARWTALLKLIFGEQHGELIGAHIVGPEATEMIAELGLAINSELTKDEIEATIHAHPTLSEAVHEATGVAYGHAIHI